MNRRPHIVPLIAALIVVAWTVWLVSCSDDSTTPEKLVYRVHDANLKEGYYCLCWNQLNQNGQQVAQGGYQVHIEASAFDTTIGFTIAGTSPEIEAPVCCDSATVSALKPSKEIPDFFGLAVNAVSYAPGDSVEVSFALPVSCKCIISVEQH
jgi:hypothetical protein